MTARSEFVDEIGSDESGGTCDETVHWFRGKAASSDRRWMRKRRSEGLKAVAGTIMFRDRRLDQRIFTGCQPS